MGCKSNLYRRTLWVCLLGLLGTQMPAQTRLDSLRDAGICTPHGFSIPSIVGVPRSKGFELYQERLPGFDLTSTENGTAIRRKVRRTKIWSARLRVPVVNKEHFKFIVGFKYYQQEFAFENPETLESPFHRSLQDKPIRSGGLSLYGIKSFIGNKYLAVRGTFRLNGDFGGDDLSAHQKSSLSVIYGIKHHRHMTYGFGVSASNTFGRTTVYPVVYYKHKFRPKWAVESLLPISLRFLYLPNEQNNVLLEARLEGDNYNVNFSELPTVPLYLEKADLKVSATYEREVHDFLWVSVAAGIRYNINFDISDSDAYFERTFPIGNTDNLVIQNQVGLAGFMRFSVFIVPPRKWVNP